MIRIFLAIVCIALLAGAGFLYLWDIPVEREWVEKPVDERVLRD